MSFNRKHVHSLLLSFMTLAFWKTDPPPPRMHHPHVVLGWCFFVIRLGYAFVATALHRWCCVLHRVPRQGTQRFTAEGNSDLCGVITRFYFLPETNKSLWGDTLRPWVFCSSTKSPWGFSVPRGFLVTSSALCDCEGIIFPLPAFSHPAIWPSAF